MNKHDKVRLIKPFEDLKVGTKGTIVECDSDYSYGVVFFFEDDEDRISFRYIKGEYLELFWIDPCFEGDFDDSEKDEEDDGKPKIVLMHEWIASPIWVREEGDDCINEGYPQKGNVTDEFVKLAEDIQDRYDSLFINNEKEFSYIGFTSKKKSREFAADLRKLSSLTKELFGEFYRIEDHFHYDVYDIDD